MRLFSLHIGLILVYIMQGLTCSPPTVEVGEKYVDEFNEIFGTNYWIPVMFKRLGGSVVGTCSMGYIGFGGITFSRSIVIDPYMWKWYDDHQRRWLIFHEMAHCALDAEHDNEVDSEGCALDIMHWKIQNGRCAFPDSWDSRLKRLVNRYKK